MAQAGVRGWGLAAGVPLPPISSGLPSRALTSTQETRRAAFALTSGFAPCSPERDQTPHCLEHPIPRKGRRDVTCKPLAQVHPPPPGNAQESSSKESSHNLASMSTQARQQQTVRVWANFGGEREQTEHS